MTRPIRTRFAPSPTGYLHVGGARTALFSWLYARHLGGTFILRIEDTDLERSTQASVDAILQGMDWLGLDYDEGPYYQTKRFDRYLAVAQQLLAEHKAYRCYCSKERLDELRAKQEANKEKPRYDQHCLHNPPRESGPSVIRFRNPSDGDVCFNDLVFGEIRISNRELDDLIIVRSDGAPTYNFTVVVDDADMGITHVIRGDDHINNTPRQINMLKALGVELPQYAHLPMILGPDGKRLSKRHGAVSVMEYQQQGVLPEALLNYLVRLGWSAGDQEIFSKAEMISLFNLDHVNRSPASFDPEKLYWLNQHYLKAAAPDRLVNLIREQIAAAGLELEPDFDLAALWALQSERVKTLKELVERSRYFLDESLPPLDVELAQQYLTPAIKPVLNDLYQGFSELSDWQAESIHNVMASVMKKHGLKLGQVAPPLRVALTGSATSPSIDATVALIGRRRVLARLLAVLL
jgi:glutamyl-tRNA synthetase